MTDPKKVHTWDQAQATLTEIAAIVAEYRLQLMAHGIPREDALRLATALQASLFTAGRRR